MLRVLLRRSDWVTAGSLADHLGVTQRSIRSYVTSINERTPGGDAIESGPRGYRATPVAAEIAEPEAERGSPRERIHALIRRLLDAQDGVDVYETALELHVSSGTVEGDLRRIRGMLAGTDLSFSREAAVITLEGPELARRRFLSRVVDDVRDEGAHGDDAIRRAAEQVGFDTSSFASVGGDLLTGLRDSGFAVNELAADDVALHIVIAADRTARGHALDPRTDAGEQRARVAGIIDGIARERLGVRLGAGDLAHLAALTLLSVVELRPADVADVDPSVATAVADALSRAARTYGVELSDERFATRLALHVQNLVERAAEQLRSRNPMTRSLKSASPMVFEMAVSISGDLSDALGVAIPDDEITDIAMHLGTTLEVDRSPADKLTATIVSPGLEEMRQRLSQSVVRALGHEIEVTDVVSRHLAGGEATTDLVLSTVDPPTRHPGDAERVVRITPFLSGRDIDRVADAANRVRRQRRLSGLRAEMARWFVPTAFVRDIDAASPDDVIRQLGAALRREGIIDDAYIESTIERERLSSTAFTEHLAVPHALTMSAARTAIAVAVNEQAIEWGVDRVRVVALAAFSESDRAAFQTVFEQFVDVFADPDNARRIARRGVDLPSFLAELAALIDEPARG